MAEEPLITTIIPTFRRPHLLKKAIQSALNQTFSNIVVRVFDNHSEDETAQVVNEMARSDARVKYHCHSSTIRAVENFQFGINGVTTSFFSILADDDLLLPTFYETALSSFCEHPSAQFFLGSALDVDEKGRVFNVEANRWTDQEYYEPPEGVFPVIEHYFNWIGALFRTAAGQKTLLDPRLTAIDFDFVLRMAAQFPYVFSKKSCAHFFHHKESYSNRCGLKIIWPGHLHLVENMRNLVPLSWQPRVFAALQQSFQRIILWVVVAELDRKNFEEAKKAIQLAQKEGQLSRQLKILRIYIKTVQRVPFFHSLFVAYRFLRRLRKRFNQ